ncbi:IclR family transcriptional regulator [Pseudonocardia spinosispora]|uniref:IclR family transcriptional regulator n=1 Tax=Pseudonocardia spinosispora TaxID=103441 RepID=UPI0003F993E5|nr:IclR family transcriptional regulator [Pseudonocardia spinosispora]
MSVQSVLRSLQVLEAVATRQPVGVADLARALDLPKSTVQRSLMTLAEAGWLEHVPGELTRWTLGPAARRIARAGAHETTLREAALGPMQELRDETNETIHLAVPDGTAWMVLVERMDSTQPVRTFNELGTRTPSHATSTGLSVLAHLPGAEVDALLASDLEVYSPTTVVDPEELRAELTAIRTRGYAVNLQRYRPQVAAIGAAVLDRSGLPVAGICISMPDSRYRPRLLPHWGSLVAEAARRISLKLG